MSMLTQGTQVYFIHPDTGAVWVVECATAFSPGGEPIEQVEDTCVTASRRTYRPGMRAPGEAVLSINADSRNASHVELYRLHQRRRPPTMHWIIGFYDSTDDPISDGNGGYILPVSRTWFVFDGYISDYPFNIQLSSVVASDISIQRSGASEWIAPEAGVGLLTEDGQGLLWENGFGALA